MKTNFTKQRAARGQCDSCEAMMINGVYCHETGCPRSDQRLIDGEWVRFVECDICGCDVRADEGCTCETEPDDSEDLEVD